MTLKQTPFELGLLIILTFLFQLFNATDNLKATRATHSFLDLNESFTELKSSDKSLFWHVFRSSRPEVFCKKGVLSNFTKFTGKHLCQRLFFNKVAGLRPATLLKRSLWHRCFPVNFVKFLRTPFFMEHLWWLLLCF